MLAALHDARLRGEPLPKLPEESEEEEEESEEEEEPTRYAPPRRVVPRVVGSLGRVAQYARVDAMGDGTLGAMD